MERSVSCLLSYKRLSLIGSKMIGSKNIVICQLCNSNTKYYSITTFQNIEAQIYSVISLYLYYVVQTGDHHDNGKPFKCSLAISTAEGGGYGHCTIFSSTPQYYYDFVATDFMNKWDTPL